MCATEVNMFQTALRGWCKEPQETALKRFYSLSPKKARLKEQSCVYSGSNRLNYFSYSQ